MVFGGLTGKDIAEVMNVSEQTVWREWRMAKAWLHQELKSIASAS
jgi:DNA-directed RNA polymerase specialized sigma subunit